MLFEPAITELQEVEEFMNKSREYRFSKIFVVLEPIITRLLVEAVYTAE